MLDLRLKIMQKDSSNKYLVKVKEKVRSQVEIKRRKLRIVIVRLDKTRTIIKPIMLREQLNQDLRLNYQEDLLQWQPKRNLTDNSIVMGITRRIEEIKEIINLKNLYSKDLKILTSSVMQLKIFKFMRIQIKDKNLRDKLMMIKFYKRKRNL